MTIPSLRQIIESLEQVEEASSGIEMTKNGTKVYRNPSQTQFTMMLGLAFPHEGRGIIDVDGDVFIWDANKATHNEVAAQLGLYILYSFYIYKDRSVSFITNIPSGVPEVMKRWKLTKVGLEESINLTEGSFGVEELYDGTKVYRNPPKYLFWSKMNKSETGELRGFVTPENDIYIWDSYKKTHFNVANELGIDSNNSHHLFFDEKYVTENDSKKRGVFTNSELVGLSPTIASWYNNPLNESHYVDELSDGTKVFKNPSKSLFSSIFSKSRYDQLRGIVDNHNQVFVWDAFDAVHDSVVSQLGLSVKYQFYLNNDKSFAFIVGKNRGEAIVLPSLMKSWELKIKPKNNITFAKSI